MNRARLGSQRHRWLWYEQLRYGRTSRPGFCIQQRHNTLSSERIVRLQHSQSILLHLTLDQAPYERQSNHARDAFIDQLVHATGRNLLLDQRSHIQNEWLVHHRCEFSDHRLDSSCVHLQPSKQCSTLRQWSPKAEYRCGICQQSDTGYSDHRRSNCSASLVHQWHGSLQRTRRRTEDLQSRALLRERQPTRQSMN